MRKTLLALLLPALLLPLLQASADSDTAASGTSRLGLGAQYHLEHPTFPELPYGDGDMSYGVVYEYHESSALWQIAVSFAPAPTSTNNAVSVDRVLTPELNLIMKDGGWRGGVGALASYIKDDDGNGDWTDVYYQFLLGYELASGLPISFYAVYPFADWSELSDFDFGEIEYRVWLCYEF